MRLKVIGLIGGMSWESTVPYYRIINETVKEKLGGLHSAKLVLVSIDFHEAEQAMHAGDWNTCSDILTNAARSLHVAGAECVVLCTNTAHKLAAVVEATVPLPLLHIADLTAAAVKSAGHTTVGLLGTRFTMEESFYRDRLQASHGLTVLTPDAGDRDIVHGIIFEELCLGQVRDESRHEYRRIMTDLVAQGAQAIILGCTEISLLVDQRDATVPLFDTTYLHARGAAEWALAD
jgi:aspartate racemase